MCDLRGIVTDLIEGFQVLKECETAKSARDRSRVQYDAAKRQKQTGREACLHGEGCRRWIVAE